MRRILPIFFLFVCVSQIHAEYILPYPGPMPGNKLYQAMRVIDALQLYWSWGAIAKTRYTMDLSDKYLVEAKTLFEYHQYLLAVKALEQSDMMLVRIPGYLDQAQGKGEDIRYLRLEHEEEKSAQRSVLVKLLGELPETFLWTPEKEPSQELPLRQLLQQAVQTRQNTAI